MFDWVLNAPVILIPFISKLTITHFKPISSFCTPEKYEKPGFDVFRGHRNEALLRNGFNISIEKRIRSMFSCFYLTTKDHLEPYEYFSRHDVEAWKKKAIYFSSNINHLKLCDNEWVEVKMIEEFTPTFFLFFLFFMRKFKRFCEARKYFWNCF